MLVKNVKMNVVRVIVCISLAILLSQCQAEKNTMRKNICKFFNDFDQSNTNNTDHYFAAVPPADDICKLPVEVGPCRAGFQRFYYDTNEAKCKLFTYGGCGGNENSFKNNEDCESRCVKTTSTPNE